MNLAEDHRTIAYDVKRTYEMHKNVVTDVDITSSQVSNLMKSLKRGCPPGADGICAEYLLMTPVIYCITCFLLFILLLCP